MSSIKDVDGGNDSDSVTFKVPSFDKIRKNPWIITSIVLGLVLIFVIFSGAGGSLSKSVIGKKEAAKNLMSFIEAQSGESAKLVSSEQEGALYKVIVEFKGEEIPVYVTLDGKYLAPGLIPLNVSAQQIVRNVSNADSGYNNSAQTNVQPDYSNISVVEQQKNSSGANSSNTTSDNGNKTS